MSEKLKINVVDSTQHSAIPTYQFEYKGSEFFIVSHEDTRHLLLHPEIVGIDFPLALKHATSKTLRNLKDNYRIDDVNIFNILRGGLNFPIEECCHENNINVVAESFLSSERVFLDDSVARLETRYNKIIPVDNCCVVLGDIVASGNTFQNAINYLFECYIKADMQPRNIIFFTIGTIETLKTIAETNVKLKKRWSNFDGIITVFYEGIFNTHENAGITGLNLAYVDFVYSDAFLAPEFRKVLINSPYSMFEKCVIYDGGARRFEKETHIKTLLEYWDQLNKEANSINLLDFVIEKYGSSFRLDFSCWLKELNYTKLYDKDILFSLYNAEVEFFRDFLQTDFRKLCNTRYEEVQQFYN